MRLIMAIGLALLSTPPNALAHQVIPIGEYAIEYGWEHEPPITGQPNAIEISIFQIVPLNSTSRITITAPLNNTAIQGEQLSVDVQIEADTRSLGLHWHLYVDDQLVTMLSPEQTQLTVFGLNNGPHVVRAALSGASHTDLLDPAVVTITVADSSASGDLTVLLPNPEAQTENASVFNTIDITALNVELIAGAQARTLSLQPAIPNSANHHLAPFTPTRAGAHRLRFSGRIGETDISSVEVTLESVQSADGLDGLPHWLMVAGSGFTVAALLLGLFAFLRRK